MTASRTTVSRCAAVLAGVYAVYTLLAVLGLVGIDGGRVAALSAGSVAVLLCGAVLVHLRAVPDRRLEIVMASAVGVPVLDSVAHIAMTGSLDRTVTLMLTVVAIAAVVDRRALAAALVGLAVVAWAVVVAVQRIGPVDEVRHTALQLGFAVLLSIAVHDVRRRAEDRLVRTRDTLADRLGELAAVRDDMAESERRFRGLFSDSPVAIGLADENGLFVEVNEAMCRLADRPAAQLLGRSGAEFLHADDAVAHGRSGDLIASADSGVASLLTRIVRPDGSVRWCSKRLTSVPGPNGENWTLGHVEDVTEQHRTEAALRRSEADLQAVTAITRCLQEGVDPRPVVLAAMRQLTAANTASLIERLDHETLMLTASDGVDAVGTRLALDSTSATTHVWATGETLFLPDAPSHPLSNPALLQLSGARSALWEPVLDQDVVVAVLAVTWSTSVLQVAEDDLRSARMLAAELGTALSARRLRTELESMATTDPLTRVPNRRRWDERAQLLLADARRSGRALTFALVDLDHFKVYNDTHGHADGDVLLTQFAAAVTTTLREVDLFARWGGEEFAVALPECDSAAAAAVLDRVRACVPAGQTCSIGYATWDGAETAAQCLSRADTALYRAKLRGRDQLAAA